MMGKRHLHIGFNWGDGDPRISTLTPIFNKAIDWIRYAPNCWIVWTSSSPETWYGRLKPLLGEKDSLFIVEINVAERQGWLSRSIWDWLKKKERTPT